MKQKEQGREIKWAIYCLLLIICLTADLGNLRAQTFPLWDLKPDGDLSAGGPGTLGPGVGSGQNIYFIEENGCQVWRWNEANGWQLIGTVSGYPSASLTCITLQGNYLYVAGSFSGIESTNTFNVAKYDLGSGQWSGIGANNLPPLRGPGEGVTAITVNAAGTVYLGGWATDAARTGDYCAYTSTNMILKNAPVTPGCHWGKVCKTAWAAMTRITIVSNFISAP